MSEEIREQARELFKTASLLKRRIARGFTESLKNRQAELVCGEMTMPQSNALMVIKERGGVTVKELAELLQVSPPSASAMVERLVEMGMVNREQSRQDRREVRIQISDKGEETMQAVEDLVLATIIEMLEKVGPEMAREWVSLYRRVREVLEEESGEKALAPAGKEAQ